MTKEAMESMQPPQELAPKEAPKMAVLDRK
jgi:hypothetical protein